MRSMETIPLMILMPLCKKCIWQSALELLLGRLGEDLDSLMDRINKAVRGVFGRWMEAAESVGQSLRDWLGSIRGRVRRTSRDNVVMVRGRWGEPGSGWTS